MPLVALVAPLVTSEVVMKVFGEIEREAHEVLLSQLVEFKRTILLALALVNLPVSNLTLPGAVTSDEALPAALVQVAGVGAAVV